MDILNLDREAQIVVQGLQPIADKLIAGLRQTGDDFVTKLLSALSGKEITVTITIPKL